LQEKWKKGDPVDINVARMFPLLKKLPGAENNFSFILRSSIVIRKFRERKR